MACCHKARCWLVSSAVLCTIARRGSKWLKPACCALSKGAAGVTGSGFIVLAATLSAVGHLPVAGLALILGIDRFMSEARALTNLVGNGVATVVVAKWVDQLDQKQLKETLAGWADR